MISHNVLYNSDGIMKKTNMSFIAILFVGMILWANPIDGWGQQSSLTWKINMDSTKASINSQSIVITKTNNYIVSNSNINADCNLTCFSSQGKILWQIKNDVYQIIDMNNANSFIATNMNNKIVAVFDYSGKIVRTLDPPANATNFKWISRTYKDIDHYYFVYTDSLNREWAVSIYDNELQYAGLFMLETNSFTVHGLITIGKNIYVSRSGNGIGQYSNVVSDLYKYNKQGNMIWKKHFLDRTDMRLALSPDGNIYIGSFNTSKKNDDPSTKAWLSWGFTKIDTAGNIIWDKSWWDEYPDSIPVSVWAHDFMAIPGGGCIISGSATKLGLGNYVDQNNIEPVMVAISDQGDKIWELRYTTLPPKYTGQFLQMFWDAENYLVVSGTSISYPSYYFTPELYKYSIDGITSVKRENSDMLNEFSLSQNYPNPFNPSTTIRFNVPKQEYVSLKVYNSLGQEVAKLVQGEKPEGNYEVEFSASNLPSGIYFYKLQAGDFVESKKMILMK